MARYVLFFIVVLAEASILMGKSRGARHLGIIPPMAMSSDEYGAWVLPSMLVPMPSPAPLAEEQGIYGLGDIPGIKRMKWHHSSNKSIAGADVILGGYATAFVAAVLCYIRVTRNRANDP